MRILHTSDWHLGASFCDRSRADEQRAFLAWLVDTVRDREVDAVVVAGDVFDTTNPPAEALEAYYEFLVALAALPASPRSGARRTVVIVGGNHDSASRLDAPRALLALHAVHVVGGYDAGRGAGGALEDPAGVLVPLRGAGGEVAAVLAAVPYLHEHRLGVRGFDVALTEQHASMQQAFSGVYRRLADRAEAAFPGVPLVATGHLTCLARAGERTTEDDAVPLAIHQVGTLGAMEPSIFDERFRYVALGHIHRGFSIDPAGRVRYCGTPVQVSAAEPAGARRVLIVDVGAPSPTVEAVAVPQRRRLLAVRGTLDEVIARIRALEVAAEELPPYVSAEVVLDRIDPGARNAVVDAGVRDDHETIPVVRVLTTLARAGGAAAAPRARDVRALTPDEVFAYAWRRTHGADAEIPPEITQRFAELVAAVGRGKELDR